ncbi:AmmeMemoRadiSam system radical SAM enzyme [Myxococcota bacterium]|nr:AmmeMemoRadiSam system radical SAM enzyme [Myxococcota bacterium]MBU1534955.1 AmmeMemoRadiSam system radical SAM enzyme [Myxococcota bacterium]
MKEALFYEVMEGKIRCHLCHHHCTIAPEAAGVCRVRENRSGKLVTLSYDNVVATAVDPVEKKPLYHVLPGSKAFSFATAGCNFSCAWCQNHGISVEGGSHRGHPISPDELVAQALVTGCEVMAATYTEPTIFYELALDVARAATEAGLVNTWVTNGSLAEAPLKTLAPFLQAANVDLKGSDDTRTRKWTGMAASSVMETITRMHDLGIWVEITTLIVPGVNDFPGELEAIARFITDLDPDIPWHLSRYFPNFRCDRPATPAATMKSAHDMARAAGVRYVYAGNIDLPGGSDTLCPQCQTPVITRRGNSLREMLLTKEHHCPTCGHPIPGIFH